MRRTKKYLIVVILASTLTGAASGMLSGHYFRGRDLPIILSADIKRIAEEKKQDIIKKYKDSNDKEQAAARLEREYADFLNAIDRCIDSYLGRGKNVLILRKEAVIDGKHKDITDEIRNAVNSR